LSESLGFLKIAAVLSKGGRQSGEIARQKSQKKSLACELVDYLPKAAEQKKSPTAAGPRTSTEGMPEIANES